MTKFECVREVGESLWMKVALIVFPQFEGPLDLCPVRCLLTTVIWTRNGS